MGMYMHHAFAVQIQKGIDRFFLRLPAHKK